MAVLRREPRAVVADIRLDVRLNKSGRLDSVDGTAICIGKTRFNPITVAEIRSRPTKADALPVRFENTDNAPAGIKYWLFMGRVYSTFETLQAEDVRALALEAENKVKAKLARAKALMTQVDMLERGGRKAIPDDAKMFVWQRDGGKCVSCGSNRSLEFDHIIPVSMGGANTARNLQLLCEGCNRAKGGSLA